MKELKGGIFGKGDVVWELVDGDDEEEGGDNDSCKYFLYCWWEELVWSGWV